MICFVFFLTKKSYFITRFSLFDIKVAKFDGDYDVSHVVFNDWSTNSSHIPSCHVAGIVFLKQPNCYLVVNVFFSFFEIKSHTTVYCCNNEDELKQIIRQSSTSSTQSIVNVCFYKKKNKKLLKIIFKLKNK